MSGRLEKLDRLAGILNPDPVVVRIDRCLRSASKDSTCSRCVEVCPAGAVAIAAGVSVDESACVGCGACAAVCPTGALEPSGTSVHQWIAQIADMLQTSGADKVAFICSRDSERTVEGAVTVVASCIGRVGRPLLLASASLGAKVIWADTSMCCDCASRIDVARLRGEAALVADALRAANVNTSISVGAVPPTGLRVRRKPGANADGGVSRRGFLTTLVREAASGVLVLSGIPAQDREGDDAPPQNAAAVVAALYHLEETGGQGITAASGLLTLPEIGHSCEACEECVRFCPTGALSAVAAEDGVAITLRPEACGGCGLCAEICSRGAIRMAAPVGPVAPDSEMELVRYRRATCTDCGMDFGTFGEEEMCRFCLKRRAIFGQ